MSLYSIACILCFLLFLVCYVLYFLLKEKGLWIKRGLLVGFLLFGAISHAFLILWGINLFNETSPKGSVLAGGLLGVFLSSCFFYPFAKAMEKKIASADMTLFLVSGVGFLIDAICIAYKMLG